VDFVIWRLFNRSSSHKLRHLLCHGFERSGSACRQNDIRENVASSIPGIVARHSNSYVHALKGPMWCRLHAILGEEGESIMIDMLTDCAIFRPVDGTSANYYQMSGPPIADLEPFQVSKTASAGSIQADASGDLPTNLQPDYRTPCRISFVRSRMFYAKAALNAKGGIRFGMRHIRQWPSTSQSAEYG
jgi:telomerase reverse transcriptase